MNALIADARLAYHHSLLSNGILTTDAKGIPSNADSSSRLSVEIASSIAGALFAETRDKVAGQSSGARFEQATMEFIAATFPLLQNIRPGDWKIAKLGNRNAIKTSSFAQYEHLDYLSRVVSSDTELAASLGNDYMVAPDIVVFRELVPDEELNATRAVVDSTVSGFADLRKANGGKPILHASISAKWTMRSDRAQNSRTEALGLIRNRKGHLPHIMVVTGEPLPSRIASLALGTGDIDCMYHFALYELCAAVKRTGAEDSIELLDTLIAGKRLKDISDLPLDLCV